jgi:hypothetical protein
MLRLCWGQLGLSWGLGGQYLGHIGHLVILAILGPYEVILGSTWVMLGPCWGYLRVIDVGPSWGQHGAILGSSWGYLGGPKRDDPWKSSLERGGGHLGPARDHLGIML